MPNAPQAATITNEVMGKGNASVAHMITDATSTMMADCPSRDRSGDQSGPSCPMMSRMIATAIHTHLSTTFLSLADSAMKDPLNFTKGAAGAFGAKAPRPAVLLSFGDAGRKSPPDSRPVEACPDPQILGDGFQENVAEDDILIGGIGCKLDILIALHGGGNAIRGAVQLLEAEFAEIIGLQLGHLVALGI